MFIITLNHLLLFVVTNNGTSANHTGLRVDGLKIAAPGQLYATGVNGAGTTLANNVIDNLFDIVSGPKTGAAVSHTPGSDSVWIANTSSSDWIMPGGASAVSSAPNGTYVYRTKADLTGYDAR